MSTSQFQQIEKLLTDQSIEYQVMRHQPVYTSVEAAEVRGTSLGSGAKALICKANDHFLMIVLPADHRLDSKAIRKEQGWKKMRFATKEEVLELTGGLTPGSIPPFGQLFLLPTYCHRGLAAHEQINFNAADHTISISMSYEDYIAVEKPTIGDYATSTETEES